MPSAFAHAAPALALIPAVRGAATPGRLWLLGAPGAAAPDLDVVAFALGAPYGHVLGHRGLSHSLAFAHCSARSWHVSRLRRGFACGGALYLCLATASHGVLDAFTDGGRGVALLAPFDTTHYFAPFRPILASPIGVGAFLEHGGPVLVNELATVWLPCGLLGAALAFGRRATTKRRLDAR